MDQQIANIVRGGGEESGEIGGKRVTETIGSEGRGGKRRKRKGGERGERGAGEKGPAGDGKKTRGKKRRVKISRS